MRTGSSCQAGAKTRAYVPVPERYVDAPFLMAVENSLTITGRGTVVTGAIERGQVRTGDPVELIGLGAAVKSVVTSVETFGKTMDSAQAGDNSALGLGLPADVVPPLPRRLARPGNHGVDQDQPLDRHVLAGERCAETTEGQGDQGHRTGEGAGGRDDQVAVLEQACCRIGAGEVDRDGPVTATDQFGLHEVPVPALAACAWYQDEIGGGRVLHGTAPQLSLGDRNHPGRRFEVAEVIGG
jgi:hypothetical protein